MHPSKCLLRGKEMKNVVCVNIKIPTLTKLTLAVSKLQWQLWFLGGWVVTVHVLKRSEWRNLTELYLLLGYVLHAGCLVFHIKKFKTITGSLLDRRFDSQASTRSESEKHRLPCCLRERDGIIYSRLSITVTLLSLVGVSELIHAEQHR